jgi:hypothetical protein
MEKECQFCDSRNNLSEIRLDVVGHGSQLVTVCGKCKEKHEEEE